MKINIDELLANMPKDEDELKTVQEKHRKILTDFFRSGVYDTRRTFKSPHRPTSRNLMTRCLTSATAAWISTSSAAESVPQNAAQLTISASK